MAIAKCMVKELKFNKNFIRLSVTYRREYSSKDW